MMWLLGAMYCGALWLIFDKLRLLRLTLPVAVAAASVGPALIVAFVLCAQYCHPFTRDVLVFQKVIPVTPQLTQPGRVTRVAVEPNKRVRQGEVLFEVDRAPYQHTVQRLTAALAEAEQGVAFAEASVTTAQATRERAVADLEFMTSERDRNQKLLETNAVTPEEYEATLAKHQQARSSSDQADAGLVQARLSVESAKAKVTATQASLDSAAYDLDQTVVRAPSDGYVTNLQLLPGALVGGPTGSVMSFVPDRSEDDRGVVLALVAQKNYLLVRPGDYAEVALASYPGEILSGRVLTTIDVTGDGQLDASGELPDALSGGAPTKFAVRIRLDDAETLRLPAGARGSAAIYTEQVPIAGLPVMFALRMQSWLHYF